MAARNFELVTVLARSTASNNCFVYRQCSRRHSRSTDTSYRTGSTDSIGKQIGITPVLASLKTGGEIMYFCSITSFIVAY